MADFAAVGIDLGTTYSAAACLNEAGVSFMVPGPDGRHLTPSAVLFDDDAVIVGENAKKGGMLRPDQYAECVKRDMGNSVYSKPIRGKFLPPEVIQAYVLRKLCDDIATALRRPFRAVITVPAFFDEPRRKATADTGKLAGLDVLDIVNEPTAAALAFAETMGYLSGAGTVREPLNVLVYDLGGGTFDVTVVELTPKSIRTLATDGDVHLGGRDWDRRLVDYVCEEFVKQHREDPRDNPVVFQRLLIEVEDAKRILSAQTNAQIVVDHSGTVARYSVTRTLFESLNEDLLARTEFTTREVLKAANLQWGDLSRVLLCGGATRMPAVHRMLQSLSGRPPEIITNPDEAVARGAAIYCGYRLSDGDAAFKVADVNSHSLGIAGVDPSTGTKRNAILIPRNTPLPATMTREFVTRQAGQPTISVMVLEGESTNPDACATIGRTVVSGLPATLPAGWPIKVTYSYAENGRLSARAQVPGTDREATLELERDHSLTPEQITRWRRVVTAPKQQATDQVLSEILGIDTDETPEVTPSEEELGFEQNVQVAINSNPADVGAIPRERASAGLLPFFSLAGHAIFAAIGLSLGYYILCWISPQANFLQLQLPGIQSISSAPIEAAVDSK